MLHVRDCCGLLSNGDVCPFPWCRKVKHLLYHLVSCQKDENDKECAICCPKELSHNLTALVGLNTYRRKKFIEHAKVFAATVAKRQQMAAASAASPVTASQLARTISQQQHAGSVQHRVPAVSTKTTLVTAPASASVAIPSALADPVSILPPGKHDKINVASTIATSNSNESNYQPATAALTTAMEKQQPHQATAFTNNPINAVQSFSPALAAVTATPSPASTMAPSSSTPYGTIAISSASISHNHSSHAITTTLPTTASALSVAYGGLEELDEPVMELEDIALSTSNFLRASGEHIQASSDAIDPTTTASPLIINNAVEKGDQEASAPVASPEELSSGLNTKPLTVTQKAVATSL